MRPTGLQISRPDPYPPQRGHVMALPGNLLGRGLGTMAVLPAVRHHWSGISRPCSRPARARALTSAEDPPMIAARPLVPPAGRVGLAVSRPARPPQPPQPPRFLFPVAIRKKPSLCVSSLTETFERSYSLCTLSTFDSSVRKRDGQ